MAVQAVINKLDEKLSKDKIIDECYAKDYHKVHSFLNKQVKKYDKALKNDDFKPGENDLRDWLHILHKKGASQEKLTSYLRCGLAHLCFDYIDLKTEKISPDEHISRALMSFKKRRYNKSYFKAALK